MSIKIKAVALKNPQDLTAPSKYYAKVVIQDAISLDDIAADITQMSTLSKADIYAGLIALTEAIPRHLMHGRIVRLGSLGSLFVSLNSSPSDSADEVSTANVKKLKLNFRPSAELRKQVEAFPMHKTS